jgi:ATP-dependent DNA helicase RecQ
VKQGRFDIGRFSDELVEVSVELLRSWLQRLMAPPTWITSVPSLRRPQPVADFAVRLAAVLALPYYPVVKHIRQHPEQKTMHNSYQQASNVLNVFAIEGAILNGPVLLVDDIADSKWTLTVVGHLLRQHGSGAVHPFALASASVG